MRVIRIPIISGGILVVLTPHDHHLITYIPIFNTVWIDSLFHDDVGRRDIAIIFVQCAIWGKFLTINKLWRSNYDLRRRRSLHFSYNCI
jgi:hypothetical protein